MFLCDNDLAPLAGPSNLRTLNLDRTIVVDLSPLVKLENLQSVSDGFVDRMVSDWLDLCHGTTKKNNSRWLGF